MSDTRSHWLSKDGLTLSAREWHPSVSPKGIVAFVHGMGEHSGRYLHVAETLIGSGYAFITFDLRGHGESDGLRGHTPSYEHLMDDIEVLLTNAQKLYPGLPLFLYGHSLGGNLVLNFALRRPFELHGVIATSPWLRLAFEPPKIKAKLSSLLNRIWPGFSQESELNTSALTHDLDIVKAYQTDPLVHNRISARLFQTVYAAGYWAIENAEHFPYPLLLMHGKSDQITSWKATEQFARNTTNDCTLRLWEGLYHELHNEPEWKESLLVIQAWLELHSP